MDLSDFELRIGRILVSRAERKGGGYITYPALATEVGWYNRTGQGLGRSLAAVLGFCNERGYPLLTSIVCATGTRAPSARGVAAMQTELGREVDIATEQARVFAFDWSFVEELSPGNIPKIDFGRLFAAAVISFEPEQSQFVALPSGAFGDLPIPERDVSVVFYSEYEQPHPETEFFGRVLGVARVSVVRDTEPLAGGQSYRMRVKRAWRFDLPPITTSTLAESSSSERLHGGVVTQLTPGEAAGLAQYSLTEVPVLGGEEAIPPYSPPAPAVHTYMVVCNDTKVLRGTKADSGQLLVKVGVSNDRGRRLKEINGNHFAVIYGILFEEYADGTWPSQARSLEIEKLAHDWCRENGRHASGEYFYLRPDQLPRVGILVKTGRL
ncbi:GIY-YIG nuclease family protein [Rhizobium laguerreae]|uniref:hypothetical protein n=1 Tax=Rhizobium laguerreae TaxID=1076926 RepID=UPI001C910504|nr:hypothetical protein [Rhizobium laguerreae]MBY3464250.1 GIY-YIG nuclease family protein [Rhizobium laguerreae]